MWSHQTNRKPKVFGPSMDDGGWMSEHEGTSKVFSSAGNEDNKATPDQTTLRRDDVVKENPTADNDHILCLSRPEHPYHLHRAKIVHGGDIKTTPPSDGEDVGDEHKSMKDATNEARKESTGRSSIAIPEDMLLLSRDVPTITSIVYGGDINAARASIGNDTKAAKTEHEPSYYDACAEDSFARLELERLKRDATKTTTAKREDQEINRFYADGTINEDNEGKGMEGAESVVPSASVVSHSQTRSTCDACGVERSAFIQDLAEQRAAASQTGDEAGGGER